MKTRSANIYIYYNDKAINLIDFANTLSVSVQKIRKDFENAFPDWDENPKSHMEEQLIKFVEDEVNKYKDQPKETEEKKKSTNRASRITNAIDDLITKTVAEIVTDEIYDEVKPVIKQQLIDEFGVIPQIHKIEIPELPTFTTTGAIHEKTFDVLKLVKSDIPVYLAGPAGSGKNLMCQHIAKALNLEFYFTNAVTQEFQIKGFIDAMGNYHETQFYKAFKDGGLFFLDEMDASIPEVLIILNAAIANRYMDFPNGRIYANENFRVIAAGNTLAHGSDQIYTGRYSIDGASLDRFALVNINYSEAIENEVSYGNQQLLEFIRLIRKACDVAGINLIASYRSIERIAKTEKMFDNLSEVLMMCLFKGMEKDDLEIISSKMLELSSDIQNNYYYIALTNLL